MVYSQPSLNWFPVIRFPAIWREIAGNKSAPHDVFLSQIRIPRISGYFKAIQMCVDCSTIGV